jgi:predicted Zn finger-like uncharacterized protein
MAITLACPSCSRSLRVPDELVGKSVRCPTCLTTFAGSPQADAPQGLAAPGGGQPSAAAVAVVPNLSLEHPEPPVPPIEAPPLPPTAPTDGEAGAGMRPCPYCGEKVGLHDERCRYCGEDVAEDEARPWERRSRRPVRRDCEPHRGSLVLVLGIVSVVVAPMVMCCYILGPVFPLVGLAIGIPAWVLGRRDLAKMKQGIMDPEGEGTTQGGMICGIIGTILNALGVLFGLVMVVYVVFMMTAITRMPKPTGAPAVPVAPPPPPPVAPPVPPNRQAPAPGLVPLLPHHLPGLAWTITPAQEIHTSPTRQRTDPLAGASGLCPLAGASGLCPLAGASGLCDTLARCGSAAAGAREES